MQPALGLLEAKTGFMQPCVQHAHRDQTMSVTSRQQRLRQQLQGPTAAALGLGSQHLGRMAREQRYRFQPRLLTIAARLARTRCIAKSRQALGIEPVDPFAHGALVTAKPLSALVVIGPLSGGQDDAGAQVQLLGRIPGAHGTLQLLAFMLAQLSQRLSGLALSSCHDHCSIAGCSQCAEYIVSRNNRMQH